MSDKPHIHIGGNLRSSKRRVLNAVARAERRKGMVETHVTFENAAALEQCVKDDALKATIPL